MRQWPTIFGTIASAALGRFRKTSEGHKMQIGMIGLGRMGASMVARLVRGGHDCVVHDHTPDAVARLVALGAVGAATLQQFVDASKAPRAVWLMVPAAAVDEMLEQLTPLLKPGDIVIDGGNSHHHDGLRRAKALAASSIAHVDVGTSGSVAGLERLQERAVDAETTPLREPAHYQSEMDLPEIAEVWRRGSMIGSWLLDLTAAALAADPKLTGYEGRVSDSGEGRWTVQAAIDEAVPTPVLSAALYARFSSRGDADFAKRVL